MTTTRAIRVTVIGRVGVEVPDVGFRSLQPAQRQLLSLLVAAGPAGLTADRLADEIWPERLPSSWQAAVRMTVSRLRRSAGTDFVKLEDGRYRLTLATAQVDAWYATQLTSHPDVTLAGGDERLHELLASADLYPGVDHTLTIEASQRELELAQVELIAGAVRGRVVLERDVLRALYRRVLAAPYDEEQGRNIAELHALAGHTGPAIELLDALQSGVRSTFGVEPTDETRALRRRIRAGAFQRRHEDPVNDRSDAPLEEPVLPRELRLDPDVPLLRRTFAHDLAAQLAPAQDAVVVLSGPPGSGSIPAIAHTIRLLGPASGTVLHGRSTQGVSVAYEPFLSFLPKLRRRISEQGLAQIEQTVLWSATAEELTELAGSRPVTLVLTRAHDIDSASADLTRFLARSSLPFALRLILAGRSDGGYPIFSRLVNDLGQLPATSVRPLDPLTVDEVAILVASVFPHASSAVLRSLAEEICHHSGGLPTIARAILETLDPTTLRLPAAGTGQRLEVFSDRVAALTEPARSVGIAAAVLGWNSSLNDIQQMCDLDPDELLDAIEELLDSGLFIETAGMDRISFANQLVMDEFIGITSGIRVRQLHMKARNLTDDPHRRARHDLLAAPTVPVSEARASQLRSARLLHAARSYREAAAGFRSAQELRPDIPLEIPDATAYADAVSRTGALGEAASIRSDVIARSIASGDWEAVLDAATVGLPEAELIDGDPERFAQLSTIPADRLPPGRRLDHALHLTRQASLLGREHVARKWVAKAESEAGTADQRAAVAVAWRLANDVTLPPSDRLPVIEAALAVELGDEARLPLLQLKALDRYLIGDIDVARAVNDEFAAIASRLANPVRQWHARLFESMSLFTIGDWEQGRRMADRALVEGQRFGITVAGPTRLAQEFFLSWVAGTHGELAEVFDTTPPDDANTLLFQAGHALALDAAGYERRAIGQATVVARRVLAAPAAHGLASAALVAPVLAKADDEEVTARVRRLLLPHAGSGLIVGAGVANLGPVDRYLWQLDSSSSPKQLENCVVIADRLQMPLWRLRTRLDLMAQSPSSVDEADVIRIAAGTDLEGLLPERR